MVPIPKALYIFLFILASSQVKAQAASTYLSGHASILGQNVEWRQSGESFVIKGIKGPPSFLVRFKNGRERKETPPTVSKLDGSIWSPQDLIRQIGLDTQSPIQSVRELVPINAEPVELLTRSIVSWENVDRIPIPIRAALRTPLKNFISTHFKSLRISVALSTNSKSAPQKLPRFLDCLLLSTNRGIPASSALKIAAYRDDLVDPCLGLITPSIPALADALVNHLAPTPLAKLYFSNTDLARPLWRAPTLIVVHASMDFHYPARMKADLEKHIQQFRKNGEPIAFLLHNDNFNDASYFVRPLKDDTTFYTETGKHPLCENCSEVTFAGGFVDWCLGLATRSYIANYFRNHATGEIKINFMADSIYTEAGGAPGTEGLTTALAEIQRSGQLVFIQKRIGQYLTAPGLVSFDQTLCPISEVPSPACLSATRSVVLSEIEGNDDDGKFYPFFGENRLRFRIQFDGKDSVLPLGSPESKRSIIFNVITK